MCIAEGQTEPSPALPFHSRRRCCFPRRLARPQKGRVGTPGNGGTATRRSHGHGAIEGPRVRRRSAATDPTAATTRPPDGVATATATVIVTVIRSVTTPTGSCHTEAAAVARQAVGTNDRRGRRGAAGGETATDQEMGVRPCTQRMSLASGHQSGMRAMWASYGSGSASTHPTPR